MNATPIPTDTTDPRVGTTFKHEGWTIRVDTEPDYESSPNDADCYTPAQVAAWRSDEWSFVGCVVTASKEGVTLGNASLWGLKYGDYTYTTEDDVVEGRGYVGPYKEAVDDLISESVDDARRTLARLCESASA